jgi:hypothetical protein
MVPPVMLPESIGFRKCPISLSLIRPPATFSQRKLGEGRDEGGDPEVFL